MSEDRLEYAIFEVVVQSFQFSYWNHNYAYQGQLVRAPRWEVKPAVDAGLLREVPPTRQAAELESSVQALETRLAALEPAVPVPTPRRRTRAAV